jgi:plasmid stabilization system protein ParE
MTQVAFQRLAVKEYRKARVWYDDRDPTVAARFVDEVNSAIDRICADPSSHPVEPPYFLWVRVRRFPYRLIYEYTHPDNVFILAVAHMSRRPRYWRRRR